MAVFEVTIKTKEGETATEKIVAVNKKALFVLLKERGAKVLSVKKGKERGKGRSFKDTLTVGRVKMQDKILFAKNLSSMIKAGMPLSRALSVMKRQSSKGMAKVLEDIGVRIGKGSSLAEAMQAHSKVFPSIFIAMVRSGEEGGSLAQALAIVGEQAEKTYKLRKKVVGSFVYPAIIVSIIVVIAILMMIFVVPTLSATFSGLGVELPGTTRAVVAVSTFLSGNILLFFASVLVLLIAVRFFFKSSTGKKTLNWTLLHTPVIKGITHEVNAARTARTLASLLSSGVDFVIAIGITKDVVQNVYYKKALARVQVDVEKGKSLSESLEKYSKLYPSFMIEMAAVGEETGQLSAMLTNVAVFFEESVEQKTKDMSTIVEPVLMVVIGVVVAVFALSMITPMYSLVDAI
jgi:type IV pilus assembly protein PilC